MSPRRSVACCLLLVMLLQSSSSCAAGFYILRRLRGGLGTHSKHPARHKGGLHTGGVGSRGSKAKEVEEEEDGGGRRGGGGPVPKKSTDPLLRTLKPYLKTKEKIN
ncbi:hypothetical protein Taro_031990 [Colocasia esculenta]|uniref:Uncharacterized protein n=1 Tax=Colocasia esculenta TaxID=4460 RepID=A0A843W0I2_COLES|nr:hypothetical protein [Colocasia esculenta]